MKDDGHIGFEDFLEIAVRIGSAVVTGFRVLGIEGFGFRGF